MTTAEIELASKLDAIATAIEQARAFEHEHGLSNRDTRKLPGDALRSLRRWQAAAHVATLQSSNVAATAPATGSQRQAVTPTPAKGAPTVPVSPTVGIRIPEPLRQRAEALAQREERSVSQVIRRALTEHVERHEPEHRQAA